jgi:hypothetical protein
MMENCCSTVLDEVADGVHIFLNISQEQRYSLGNIGILFGRLPPYLWEAIEAASLAVSVLDTERARVATSCNNNAGKSSPAFQRVVKDEMQQVPNDQGPPDEELKTFDMATFGIIRYLEMIPRMRN